MSLLPRSRELLDEIEPAAGSNPSDADGDDVAQDGYERLRP